MQFGIFDIMQVLPGTTSQQAFDEHLAAASLADELGLDFYFAAERHFMPYYRTPSASVWLAAAAARTQKIRLGAMAYTVALHNPVRLAEEISMLDHLSGGRMEVGLGLGHRVEELVSLGVDPELRQLMLIEGIVLIDRAFRGEVFQHPGQVWQFSNLYVEPPLQPGGPPLWYAGNDPQAIEWSGRNGLSAAIGFQPDERLLEPSQAFQQARQNQKDAGENVERLRLALMRGIYVAESDEQATEDLVAMVTSSGATFSALLPPGQPPKEPPTPEEAREQVERMHQERIIVSGGPERVARYIGAANRRLGIDVFLANPWQSGVSREQIERTIRLYATEVVPRARKMV